jgi:hypothetical protein
MDGQRWMIASGIDSCIRVGDRPVGRRYSGNKINSSITTISTVQTYGSNQNVTCTITYNSTAQIRNLGKHGSWS